MIKRIPLLFFLGIGIPCLLLGYLAFRGIRNDQALLEKERLNEQRKISELITGSVRENISETERAFFPFLARNRDIDQQNLIHSLDSLKNLCPLAEEVFISDASGKIHFPAARFLFLPYGSIQSVRASSRTPVQVRKLQTGQQLEFQEKKYEQALALYRDEFTNSADPAIKAELLSVIARVQKKSMLFRDAIKTWETITRDYNQFQTAGGVPLGLAARLEISSLSLATGDSAAALKAFLELYNDLITGEWTLEKSQYDFFSRQINVLADTVFSKTSLSSPLTALRDEFSSLKEEERIQRNNTERWLTFGEIASAELIDKALPDPAESQSSPKRFLEESKGHTFLVSVLNRDKGNGNQTGSIQGLIFSEEYLKDSLLLQLLKRNTDPGKTGWLIKGSDNKILLESENPVSGPVTVSAEFEDSFPPWSVELYQQNPDLLQNFIISRRGIYFFIFILLAGILIFGLILTIRTVTHELELSRMKSDFVSTISHEFKSPLSSIRQLSEMLQSGRVPSEEHRRQYYDVLVEQSERLSLLIDNILDFAKIEEGRKIFEFEMADIGPLLNETILIIQDRVRHKNFIIQPEIEKSLPPVRIDRAAITQAINNLIDNAIKYSGEARSAIIRAYPEDRYMVIEVKDFGIGIRKEDIDKVFERFYRGGDELTRKVKGSGLGLTLVKKIVEAHGGEISVISEIGKGSIFRVRIPLG